jgi:t-SNARE complex subunit (syntaxin)
MSEKLQKLNNELKDMLLDFDSSNRSTIQQKITAFEKDCLKLTNEILPNYQVPIYMKIHKFDNNKPMSEATWEDWKNPKNKFANMSDSYCRDVYENGNLVYPVLNANTGIPFLRSCGVYIDDEMKKITNLKDELSALIAEARNTVLLAESRSGSSKKTVLDNINRKLKEYETLQDKYIQIVKMLDNFTLLLKNKRDIVENKNDKYEQLQTDLNIKRDAEDEFNEQFHRIEARNSRLLFWGKIVVFICWLIVLGLFSMININRVIT